MLVELNEVGHFRQYSKVHLGVTTTIRRLFSVVTLSAVGLAGFKAHGVKICRIREKLKSDFFLACQVQMYISDALFYV